jgi:transposase
MEIMIERGCGLDVHKETIVACIKGKGIKKEIRTYSSMTNDLLRLKEWLKENLITHIAMESTGVYWKPVFNILEDSFEVILVNARHIKNVPGRKTDVQDSEWLCKLLRNGLVKGSFIPPKDMRDLRDLTRYRKKLIGTIGAEKNRIEKILQDGNIKLSSVASDIFGVSGSNIIKELLKEESSIEKMLEQAKSHLKKKKEELKEALTGKLDNHHKFMVKASLEHIASLEKIIIEIDSEIDKKMDKYREEYELLQTIPGVKEIGAASIIAEIGVDMNKFPDEGHLSSWAGISPGNNESAGKKKSCRTTQGNKALKVTLTECAWAATKTKNTYLRAKYNSLAGRRGKKRALIAVAHKVLIACYYILKYKVPYRELGVDYLDRRKQDRIKNSYVKRLTNLGYNVVLEEAT